MTREEAIKKFESGWWKTATTLEIVEFQMFEDKLCMDFSDFHGAVESVLGRPVFTHEFASWGYLGNECRAKIETMKGNKS